MGNDSAFVSCTDVKDAISAMMDHEQPDIDPHVVDAHVAGCAECADFQRASGDIGRRFRLREANEPADRSREIAPLAAMADRAGNWRIPRVLLFVVALEVLVLSVVDMIAATGSDGEVHSSRHLSAFTISYGVLLMLVVVRPARARTALPVAAVLAVALAITGAADLAVGRIPLAGEALHLPELVSVLLVFLLAVPGPRRRARQESLRRE